MWILLIFVYISSISTRHVGELLCRQCGASITRQSELINITGVDQSQLQYEYDFPLAGKTTKVNVLTNPENQKFHVFGAKTAHLHFHGTPQSHATWYPGYKWTICLCKSCSRHMGWYFEPEKSTAVSEKKSFVGLVLDNVISADYVDTLTKVPDF
ncbi:CULT domain-containing protein [Caenorhabditis elegans]|uniref:CULT domain-containing protein n=1 Tax=Caenorhabditis elegans TaxID=6239 RepID=Q9XVW5_CAEEL|nr:Protein yippee-like [Caenorhabditis elegans]CAA92002.1 Protein yippee-like [Caenorhabditis elegans]|eukprot:NP_509859.1 Protein yippee-like [Caenorhabditis elegans]